MKFNKPKTPSQNVAFVGICVAFAVILLFGANLFSATKLTICAVSGLLTGIVIIETNIKNAVLFFVATSLLAFLILPNKTVLLMYCLFFGLYAFFKRLAEKLKHRYSQIILKLMFFAIIMLLALTVFKALLFSNVTFATWQLAAFAIGGMVLFAIYDYIYTLVLDIYTKKFRNIPNHHFNEFSFINFKSNSNYNSPPDIKLSNDDNK